MSNTTYIAYNFTVSPLQPATEILIAELGYAGFESFVETTTGVTAYIQKEEWHETILEYIQILNSSEFKISYDYHEVEQTNWNAEWEKNFNPIVVDDTVTVRAPFHNPATTTYDLVIEPKMSFGTGHHETTHMMIQHILQNDFKGKSVLDMGCGTGVLAILAEKMGAVNIQAIDIDEWCYLNSLENIKRNQCKEITVKQGDVDLLKAQSFDIIIANINRNILLHQIPQYAECLTSNGLLFLSGFYENDIPMLEELCHKHLLKLDKILKKGDWVSLKLIH